MSRSLRVVLILLALSLAALVVTGAPIYGQLSVLWGGLLLVSWAWSRLALRGVSLARESRARRAEMGQVFEEEFNVRNNGRLPRLWVEVRDESPLPASQGSHVLTMLRARQESSYRARTRLLRRGVFPLGSTSLISGDPFGLFTVRRSVPSDAFLLVYPMMVDVRSFPAPAGLLPGGETLRRRTHHVTPNAAGVREYAPGDPLNRIHWASTARRDRFMVKEFELDPLAEVWIVADAERRQHTALPHSSSTDPFDVLWYPKARMTLPPSTTEYTASIVASLARHFLGRGRAVGLVLHDQALYTLPPDRGGRQLYKVLEAMALLRAEGRLPLLALATAQTRYLPRGSTVILVTPSTHKDVALTAVHILKRGLRPLVVLLDAASFGGAEGTTSLVGSIRALNVPVCQVTCGSDLAVALSQTRV